MKCLCPTNLILIVGTSVICSLLAYSVEISPKAKAARDQARAEAQSNFTPPDITKTAGYEELMYRTEQDAKYFAEVWADHYYFNGRIDQILNGGRMNWKTEVPRYQRMQNPRTGGFEFYDAKIGEWTPRGPTPTNQNLRNHSGSRDPRSTIWTRAGSENSRATVWTRSQPDNAPVSPSQSHTRSGRPINYKSSQNKIGPLYLIFRDDGAPCVAYPIANNKLITARHCLSQDGGPVSLAMPGIVSQRQTVHPNKTLSVSQSDLAILTFAEPMFQAQTRHGTAKPGEKATHAVIRSEKSITESLEIIGFYSISGGPANSHYVTTRASQREHDSGSPLFNSKGELIGVLNGCNATRCYYYRVDELL